MFEWYHWTLLAMAAVSIAAAWRVPRAPLWVGLGGFCYLVSAMWHNYGFPYPLWVGAAGNFLIVILIVRYAITRWEMLLGHCIVAMLLVDLLFAVGVIETQFTFAVALEIINIVAMLLVTGVGILDRARHGNLTSGLSDWRLIRRGHRSAFAERKPYPRWWRVW